MFYAYVIESLKNKRRYVGTTDDLERRLAEHNRGLGGNIPKIIAHFVWFTTRRTFINKMPHWRKNFIKLVTGEKFLKEN